MSTNQNQFVLIESRWQNRVSKRTCTSYVPVWTNFYLATLKSVLPFEPSKMAKSFWRHYGINNLTWAAENESFTLISLKFGGRKKLIRVWTFACLDLIIWRHGDGKEIEESKETMALEVFTEGNNDKTEKNDWEYVHSKRTRDGTFFLSFFFLCRLHLC